MLLEILCVLAPGCQAPEPPVAPAAILPRVLLGPRSGREIAGSATGPCHWRGQTLLHGSWFLLESYALGEAPRQDQLMLREMPDGSIVARSFSSSGRTRAWQGTLSRRGLLLQTLAEESLPQWRQIMEWSPTETTWRLERQLANQPWAEIRRATLGLAKVFPPPRTDPAILRRTRALPYAWYLGTLEGPELSLQGPTLGTITTRLDLGSWFRSSYRSVLAGTEIYSGEGWISSNARGAYTLWWFDMFGSQERLAGQMIPGGARVEKRDSQGKLLELHRDVQIEDGYEFTIEVLDPELDRLVPAMTGAYQRTSPSSPESKEVGASKPKPTSTAFSN